MLWIRHLPLERPFGGKLRPWQRIRVCFCLSLTGTLILDMRLRARYVVGFVLEER
jgi:hypothetical protein